MSLSKGYIILRCNKTLSCMKVIRDDAVNPWEWSEKSADDFEDDLDALGVVMGTENTESAEAQAARGERDGQLSSLQRKGQEFVKLGKLNFRNDPGKLAVLKPLKVHSTSVSGKLREAEKVASAWAQIPTYVPSTGNTKAAFDSLLATCQTKYRSANDEGAEAREATGDTSEALMKLYRVAVDWYQEAFRRFPVDTAHGDLIRAEIPTQNGGPSEPPAAPSLSGEFVGSGAIDLHAPLPPTADQVRFFFAAHGTGEPFVEIGASETGDFTHGDRVPGEYDYFAKAVNEAGESEASNTITVTVV